jgi:hypothetical protein
MMATLRGIDLLRHLQEMDSAMILRQRLQLDIAYPTIENFH